MTTGRPKITLEICVDTPDGLATAVAAGADRIELCSSLDLGGLTPSPGLMALAGTAPIPVYAMIRPRAGDFVFTARDVAAMRGDIEAARAAGLAGVVLGASRPDRSLDTERLAELSDAAAGLGRTLHRAFDLAPDLDEALELAVALGFERVLTSGGARTAPEGTSRLAALVAAAAGRISVMPGSGARPENVADLVRRTGACEVHASARRATAGESDLVALGFVGPRVAFTDGETIGLLRAAVTMDRGIKQSDV